MDRNLPRHDMWINGSPVPGTPAPMQSIDPSWGRAWAQVAQADDAAVSAAVDAARNALNGGEWPAMSSSQRGACLLRFGELLRLQADRLAQLESRDNGKPLWQTRAEVAYTANWYTYFGGAADKIEGMSLDLSATRFGRTAHRPVGVTAILSPFNGPMSLTSWKLAPALAMGNTVVIKPSPDASVTPIQLAMLAQEAGIPQGVVNTICGDAAVGSSLTQHPGVDLIAFTGSTGVGRLIAATAGKHLKRCMIEAGGKSPFIVFEDADLDIVIPHAVGGIFGSTGQSCVASSRFVVHSSRCAEFADRMRRRIEILRVGDPFHVKTHIGPIATGKQFLKVLRYIDQARREGLNVIQGQLSDEVVESGGFYVPPTLILGVSNDLPLAQEEIFGPVGVVIPFESEAEAVAIANGTDFGLAAGVFTRDASRAHRVANQLQAGTIWINTYRAFHWSLPFGGYKQSGFGRDNGLEALREFSQLQTVVTDYGSAISDPYAS